MGRLIRILHTDILFRKHKIKSVLNLKSYYIEFVKPFKVHTHSLIKLKLSERDIDIDKIEYLLFHTFSCYIPKFIKSQCV